MLNEKERAEAVRRLRTIEGQIRGLQTLMGEECPCVDFLTQLAAVHEALRKVGKMVTHNYLETCATKAISSKSPASRKKAYGDLMDLIYKYSR